MRGWACLAILLAVACNNDEPPGCRQLCARLTECKLEAKQGAPILGERKDPPDAECLERCAQRSDYFATCEAKQKDCGHLLACTGSLR